MLKRLLLRTFGSGRLPKSARRLIESERCELLLEGLAGSTTRRNFSAPGKRSSWRRQWFLGAVAISQKRVLVYRYRTCMLNVPFNDTRAKEIDFSAETSGVLEILHDASLFHPTWSGEIETCFETPEAIQVCSVLATYLRKVHKRQSGRAPAR